MPASDRNEPSSKPRGAPEVVAPTNLINVALPFSKIETRGPSREMPELASIVAELAEIVEGLAPGDKGKRVRERSQALLSRLR